VEQKSAEVPWVTACTRLIDEDNLSLPIGQLAELWGLFARSRLLYGSEVWSVPSASALEKLEVTQAMAGRQILGKSGSANIIREPAVLGDLGRMSIKSHLRLAKLRLFGRLQMLPNSSLAKKVHLFAKNRFSQAILSVPAADVPACWCSDVYVALKDPNVLVDGKPSRVITAVVLVIAKSNGAKSNGKCAFLMCVNGMIC
jgi:hypothetical protein